MITEKIQNFHDHGNLSNYFMGYTFMHKEKFFIP